MILILKLMNLFLSRMEVVESSSQAPDRPCGPPPPETVYASEEAAWQAIQAHASANGYRMVKNGHRSGRARFRCAKGRKYKSHANPETHDSKRRKTSTQFTSCKFQLAARPLPDGQWAVELPDGINTFHNHGWSDPAAFAAVRAEQLAPWHDEVIMMANAGSRVSHILARVNVEKKIAVTGKDISNLLQRHRRDELRGRSPIQTLYEDFLQPAASQFVWEDTRDSLGHVTSLTIAPKSGLELLRYNPDLLLLDSTYKTNSHNMPLFNACGVTSLNKTFS